MDKIYHFGIFGSNMLSLPQKKFNLIGITLGVWIALNLEATFRRPLLQMSLGVVSTEGYKNINT